MEKNEELRSKFSKVTSFSETSNSNADSNTNFSKKEISLNDLNTKTKLFSKNIEDEEEEYLGKEDFFENEAELSGIWFFFKNLKDLHF